MRYLSPFFILLIVLTGFSCKQRNKTEKNSNLTEPCKTNTEQLQTNPYDTFSYTAYNDIACFIAGNQLHNKESFLSSYFDNKHWKNYATQFSSNWNTYNNSVISVIQQWSNEHLVYGDTIFYPFSGPDYNYLNAFFPEANYAVLIGLESAGSIPEPDTVTTDSLANYLDAIHNSIYFNLKVSYFRTKSMKNELNSVSLNGTIPIIMLFLNRHGKEILNIHPVEIDGLGNIINTAPDLEFVHDFHKEFDNGVVFTYRDTTDSTIKKLVYFSMDLSNTGLKDGNLKLVENVSKNNTVFLKAASYLCFQNMFTTVKSAILNNASQIITDPSGMPYMNLRDTWDVTLHGEYSGPIALFSGRKQDELRHDIDSLKPARLPFKFGYHPVHWCMIVANRK